MKPMTNAQRIQLLENGRKSRETDNVNPTPVVKLFTPDANATGLLTELDPEDADRALGLYCTALLSMFRRRAGSAPARRAWAAAPASRTSPTSTT